MKLDRPKLNQGQNKSSGLEEMDEVREWAVRIWSCNGGLRYHDMYSNAFPNQWPHNCSYPS